MIHHYVLADEFIVIVVRLRVSPSEINVFISLSVILGFLSLISRAFILQHDREWLFGWNAGRLALTLFVRTLYCACRWTSSSTRCQYYTVKNTILQVIVFYD